MIDGEASEDNVQGECMNTVIHEELTMQPMCSKKEGDNDIAL